MLGRTDLRQNVPGTLHEHTGQRRIICSVPGTCSATTCLVLVRGNATKCPAPAEAAGCGSVGCGAVRYLSGRPGCGPAQPGSGRTSSPHRGREAVAARQFWRDYPVGRSRERDGGTHPPENRCCRSGCQDCSCCGSPSGSSSDCCSRNRHAARGGYYSPDPLGHNTAEAAFIAATRASPWTQEV